MRAIAYYNEIDPAAAEWLRQLIKLGAIAPGNVDERSIVDVPTVELEPYCQLHFFAGIGVWSYSLRQAGWPDDRPIVTGSCPCQPFSSAGKRKGAGDERDLWWAMFWHCQQLRPQTIIGEQVASKDGLIWWDVVQSDLEGEDYAATAFDLCAAGIGAPHIRQRLFWVAVANGSRLERARSPQPTGRKHEAVSVRSVETSSLADASSQRRQQITGSSFSDEAANGRTGRDECEPNANHLIASDGENSESDIMADTTSNRCIGEGEAGTTEKGLQPEPGTSRKLSTGSEGRSNFGSMDNPDSRGWNGSQAIAQQAGRRQPENASFWDDAEWLPCADGKARPAKRGAFPLAHGVAADLVCSGDISPSADQVIQTEVTSEARTMRLRGYGNAIVAPLAIAFIEAVMEAIANYQTVAESYGEGR